MKPGMKNSPPGPLCRGFTLVELMIGLFVAAILLAIAIPGFGNLVRDNRMASAVNALVGGLQSARMEAVRRNRPVTICMSSNGTACTTNGNWNQGWILFAENDVSGNTLGVVDNGETILRTHGAIGNNIAMTSTLDHVTFQPAGTPSQNGNVKVCDDRTGNTGRQLNLLASGRLRVNQGVSCP